jgi:hypothetical protein
MIKWKCLAVALIAAVTASAFVAPAAMAAGNFEQLVFTLKPGSIWKFKLPAKSVPVRIEVSFSLENAGTQTPSEIMYAVVNEDSSSQQETWVGTNSNGTQQGCNSGGTLNCVAVTGAPFTPSDSIIAAIFGGIGAVNAILEVGDQVANSNGLLDIEQSGTTTSIDGHYIVNLWW